MSNAKDVNITEFKGDARNLVKAIDEIKGHSDDLDKSLQVVLTHLNAIEHGVKNVNSITNNSKSITNTVSTKYNTNTFDFGNPKKVVKGHSGFMTSDSGREKNFKEYEQAVINETKEITKDIAERRRHRKQLADAQTTTANAASLRASKLEDQTSARYLNRMDKLAEARMLNAKANQTGAFLKDPRYQTARTLSAFGNIASSYGNGGKIIGSVLDSVGMLIKTPVAGTATAVINLAQGISNLGKEAVKAFSEIEAIKTQLGVVFSNQTQADSMFGQISKYAVKSPFGVQQTSELAVLLKQSGVYATDLMDTLKMLGDTAGGNMEKMKRIANNYAQIVSIGKASMLDMRQFAYAGIPIFEAVSKELGVSQQQLRKLISDGKVTSDIIEKVFKDLTGINGIFENATEKGAKTLKARLQNLSDARQLAYASRGERLLNMGSYTGKDGYVTNIVSWMEKLYEEIKDKNELKNIEQSVQHIENRENEIEQTKQLIEYQKAAGNDTKYLEQYLKNLEAKRNPDSDRATYEAMYNALMSGGKFSVEELSRDVKEILQQEIDLRNENHRYRQDYWADNAYNLMYHNQGGFWGGVKDSGMVATSLFNGMTGLSNATQGSDQRRLIEANLLLIEHLQTLREQINNLGKITAEQIKAHKETNTINAQQLAYDQMNKNAGARDSLSNSFKELSEIYKNSDEYKQQEEEKRQKRLTDALNYLKVIAENTDESGRLDVSKYSEGVLSEMNKNGVLNAGRKLSIVTSASNLPEDRATLMKNLNPRLTGGNISFLRSIGATQEADKITALYKSLDSLTDEEFFDQFGTIFDDINYQLDTVLKRVKGNSGYTNKIKEIKEALGISLNEVEIDTEGKNATTGMINQDSAKYEFVPLWKRILSSATGLSTQGMTGTLQTMQNYRDDMAIRNMTSSVLSATMKSMGIDTAMGLVKTAGNGKVLRGDTGTTYQVDWKATKDAIKQFSLTLSASTEVVTAYKNSLQQELDTYEQLIAAGYTEAESQDLKNQKTVSTKTLEKLSQDAGDQLVNAFGEGLKTKSGKTAFFNGTDFVDSEGNKLQEEEIILTGNLFEFIKSELPRLRKEITEATVAETNKKTFDAALAEVLKWELGNRATDYATTRQGKVSGFLLDSPEYVASQFDAIFSEVLEQYRENPKYADIISGGKTNILSTAMMATPEFLSSMKASGFSTDRYEAANELVQLALDAVVSAAEKLGIGESGSAYQKFLDYTSTTDFNEIVQKRYRTLLGTNTAQQMSLLAYPEQGGIGGTRGVSARALNNFFGLERNYDLQSLYEYGKKTGGDLKYKDTEVVWGAGEELSSEQEKLVEAAIRYNEAMRDTQEVTREMGADLQSAFGVFTKSAWEKPFEVMSKNLVLGKDATEGMEDAYKNLSAELLSASSEAMVKAGWELVARGAADKNYGMIAGGLGLVAAGGVAAGLGSALTEKDEKDKKDKQTEKLEALKSDLQKLLEQARTDALYYENNLRHQTALGINKQFSYKSVHDAILTPKGDVVTTDPKDYLIATKTPQQLVDGNNVTVQPVINCNVVNNTSAKVTQEQQVNEDGSIDIITLIEEVTGGYIASSRSDDAFASREYRVRGRQAIM